MEKLHQEKEIVSLEKKILKLVEKGELPDSQIEQLRGLARHDLDIELLRLAKQREETVSAQKNDEELQKKKEEVRELNAPYAEQLKKNKLLARFVALLIGEKE